MIWQRRWNESMFGGQYGLPKFWSKENANDLLVEIPIATLTLCRLEMNLRCFDTVFWDHTSLFESALRQSSPCQINVKFALLVDFGLNFSVVYIL